MVEAASVAAVNVLNEIVNLRLEIERARDADFGAFCRFVRHRRADWGLADVRSAAAELYAGLLATTLPRRHGVASLGALCFSLAERGLRPARAPASGPAPSGGGALELTPADLVVAALMGAFMHLVNFTRLDLVQKQEYMCKTLDGVLTEALTSRVAVNSLAPGEPGARRPVPLGGGADDPADGALFAIRAADWDAGRLSPSDVLAVWRHAPDAATRATVAELARLIPGGALTTISVLARMCIPGDLLAALWTTLAVDSLGAQTQSYDAFLARRLDAPSTVHATGGPSEDAAALAAAAAAAGGRPALFARRGAA